MYSSRRATLLLARSSPSPQAARHCDTLAGRYNALRYSTTAAPSQDDPDRISGAKLFYRQLVPSMLAVLAISSTVYYSLELVHSVLDRQLYLETTGNKVQQLENELEQVKKRTTAVHEEQVTQQRKPGWRFW
ncbi:hypothetical protein ACM66B_002376 [Microbotryomycetes sp. NB124-2]